MYTVALFRLILSRRHGHLYVPDAYLDSLVRVVFQVWPIHGNCEYYFFSPVESFPVSVCLLLQFGFMTTLTNPSANPFSSDYLKNKTLNSFFCIAAFYFRAIMVLLILWYNA